MIIVEEARKKLYLGHGKELLLPPFSLQLRRFGVVHGSSNANLFASVLIQHLKWSIPPRCLSLPSLLSFS